jgi:hypothetical protein
MRRRLCWFLTHSKISKKSKVQTNVS